ncbi:MAG: hypothetical protein LBM56_05990 [Burkholderiaceae bacterium]|jgi:hypothetical protein|nr:hypothetical protein [Burkholderiaceae bacterium]
MRKTHLFVVCALIVLSGCVQPQKTQDQEEMYTKAASLQKLSKAVEATQYEEPPSRLENAELLKHATTHNPRLLEGFDAYTLKAKAQNGHTAVLMCDAPGQHGLIEDTGCTGKVDMHHWKTQPLPPCEFTINLDVKCQ